MRSDTPRSMTLDEKREHFAKFITLLTGELGVSAVFGSQPGSHGSKQVSLPLIENLDAKRLDFLYALCLREAGLLSMSKRSVSSIVEHPSQGALGLSFAIESGRVERALMRKFAGAQEILDHHWKIEATDPELSAMAFGMDPKQATLDQAFAWAAKWALVGKPSYGWDKAFEPELWAQARQMIEAEPFCSLISSSTLRKWEDSVDLSSELWSAWILARGGDKTPKLSPSPKAKALADVKKALETDLPQALSPLLAQIEALKSSAEAKSAQAKTISASIAPRLDQIERERSALEKQKRPFESFSELLMDRQDHLDQAQQCRDAAAQARSELAAAKQTAQQKAEQAKQSADQMAQKGEQKAQSVEQQLSQAQHALEQAQARAQQGQISDEHQARIDELNAKIQELASASAARQAELAEQIQQAQQKAASGSEKQRAQAQAKAQSLQEQASGAQAKADAKAQNLRDKLAALERDARQSLQDQVERLQRSLEALQERLQKAQQTAQARQQKAEGASQLGKRDSARIDKLTASAASNDAEAASHEREAQQLLSQIQKETLKNPSLSSMTPEELMAQVSSMEEALDKLFEESQALEAPVEALTQQARADRQQAKSLNQKASTQAHQTMSALQDQMDAQGVQLDLVERMEEIDGWAEANQAQRDFDERATKELGQPVINGSGGGAGARDVMEQISLKAAGIEELNPNEIFSGVEKLSPLSGFSQSGGADGGSSSAQDASGSSGAGLSSIKAHLVWRKDRDKVIPAPTRDARLIQKLASDWAPTIESVKRVIKSKLKPSFKTVYKGGREEGLLDARSIWKLAAHQGDDFFEIDSRRPDRKAAASVLVDVSGSLAALGSESRDWIAGVALALSEGLDACGIDHEVLGHCAPHEPDFADQRIPATFNRKSCRLDLLVAKRFGERDRSGLASLAPQQADNSDGEALRLAVARLLKKPAKKRVLFMLSDAKPFMQDADTAILDEDLRRAVFEATQKGVRVISIGLGAHEHPVLGSAHASLQKPEDLARALERLLS